MSASVRCLPAGVMQADFAQNWLISVRFTLDDRLPYLPIFSSAIHSLHCAAVTVSRASRMVEGLSARWNPTGQPVLQKLACRRSPSSADPQ